MTTHRLINCVQHSFYFFQGEDGSTEFPSQKNLKITPFNQDQDIILFFSLQGEDGSD